MEGTATLNLKYFFRQFPGVTEKKYKKYPFRDSLCPVQKFEIDIFGIKDKWVPVTTGWSVLRLLMEERPPDK